MYSNPRPTEDPTVTELFAERALLPAGWARDVRLRLAADGTVESVTPGGSADGAGRLPGPLLPGMANLHSHAFQRAMAGLAETVGDPHDSFWSWREQMYALVARLDPQQVEAIAAQLCVELLKGGYTAVGEFHYLHHDAGGNPYADPAEMAWRVLAGAGRAGIAVTLLPVLYSHGGFGGRPAGPGQRRFLNDTDAYASLWNGLRQRLAGDPLHRIGLCFHSLRAVTPEQIERVLALDAAAPVHIHVAEQTREVDDCLEWSGQRPVEWLLDHAPVDDRWCLVHATHVNAAERGRLAACGAVAGLCPSTEANLGDGVFPAADYVAEGGRLGIGSDSHVSVGALEELRLLEYGQRLVSRHRNRIATAATPSVGRTLYSAALGGGHRALAQPAGVIEPGARADLVVLDGDKPLLAGAEGDNILNRWLFAGDASWVRDVYVAGTRVVHDGVHPAERETAAAFARVLRELQ